MKSNNEDLLFSEFDLRLVIEQKKEDMIEEISSYNRNYILNTSAEDLGWL